MLPHPLAELEHIEFGSCVREHREPMAARWTNIEIDAVEQEHQALVAAFSDEPALKSALLACNSQMTFDEGWVIVKDRFKNLQMFVVVWPESSLERVKSRVTSPASSSPIITSRRV